MECLGAENTNVADWKEFQNHICWRVVEGEIKARDEYIVQCLRLGDESWTDGEMRARLNELEYVLTIPQAIMTDLLLSQQNQKTNNEKGVENE